METTVTRRTASPQQQHQQQPQTVVPPRTQMSKQAQQQRVLHAPPTTQTVTPTRNDEVMQVNKIFEEVQTAFKMADNEKHRLEEEIAETEREISYGEEQTRKQQECNSVLSASNAFRQDRFNGLERAVVEFETKELRSLADHGAHTKELRHWALHVLTNMEKDLAPVRLASSPAPVPPPSSSFSLLFSSLSQVRAVIKAHKEVAADAARQCEERELADADAAARRAALAQRKAELGAAVAGQQAAREALHGRGRAVDAALAAAEQVSTIVAWPA